jgi:hypothetical protein
MDLPNLIRRTCHRLRSPFRAPCRAHRGEGAPGGDAASDPAPEVTSPRREAVSRIVPHAWRRSGGERRCPLEPLPFPRPAMDHGLGLRDPDSVGPPAEAAIEPVGRRAVIGAVIGRESACCVPGRRPGNPGEAEQRISHSGEPDARLVASGKLTSAGDQRRGQHQARQPQRSSTRSTDRPSTQSQYRLNARCRRATLTSSSGFRACVQSALAARFVPSPDPARLPAAPRR